MKLIFNGEKYDLEAGIARADLYTLFELKSKYGVGMKSLLGTAQKMKGLDPIDLLEDTELFQTFLVIIWLARRYAGEKLTLEEAAAIPISELQWDAEEEEAEQPDPPQAPQASARGGDKGPARSTSKGTSKTSRSR